MVGEAVYLRLNILSAELEPKMNDHFFRALDSPTSIQAWTNGAYRSGHLAPLDWYRTWDSTRSVRPEDYSLKNSLGFYSEAARATFLKVAAEGRLKGLTEDEARAIGELGGVCAWTTPLGALNYVSPQSPARKGNWDQYVEFVGTKLADDPVEGAGAVIATVEREVRRQSWAEFRRQHAI